METKWWSKLLAFCGVLAALLLLAAPMLYKFGISELRPVFTLLMVAMVLAVLVIVAGLVALFIAIRKGLVSDRNLSAIGLVIALVPVIVLAPSLMKGRSVPPIHDITTDTANPPLYERAVELRASALNDLVYGSEVGSPGKLAAMQQAAYPDLHPLTSGLSVPEAVARAAQVLTSMGLEVVNEDAENGRVEAVATTFWFGFKDDVVVRVRATDSGTRIDVRSVSRVGQSDLGANAARISQFLAAF
ncbi:MAG: DUF1499 domain-containing protein [Pseudomonadales bacterium]|nr:DUF1499 domain-containing protein [Pseudomonadales bacterium]